MSHVRVISQAGVAENLNSRWSESVSAARKLVDALERELRQMDELASLLQHEHQFTVAADLGPVGNAAAATRRDLVERGGTMFAMPA